MPPAPTPPAQRDAAIDLLRGVALFGVLLENLQHFASPSYSGLVGSGAASSVDRLVLGAIRLFCDNKVYLLFAFLFGYGIALQMLRDEREERGFAGLHLTRMACLFLIGVANLLLWSGDILTTYAVLGCLLLPLRRRSDALLVRLAGLLLLAPTLATGAIAAAGHALSWPSAETAARTWAHLYPARQSCFSFAMFALGLAAGRQRILSDAAWLERARRALPLALGLGLAGNLAFAVLEAGAPRPFSGAALAREATLGVAAPSLAFSYGVLALGWARRHPGSPAIAPLAAVGRATLTNYVAQSAIGTGVLARLGPIHPPAGVLLALAIYAAQVWVSALWLRRFRFGPIEWAWRSLAYGRREPLRQALP